MICFPKAKINLGLNIIEKRDDGFHNIETVFYPLQWCDVLEVIGSESGIRSLEKKEKIEFMLSGLNVNGDFKNNLCVKAYDLLDKEFDLSAVKIHLHKIIPMGAGLGGGSADAAFTLKLLNVIFNLKLNIDVLKNYAQQLGSDVPFFIENAPVFAHGRGELMEKINVSLKEHFILIVKPGIHISTAEAYSNVKLNKPEKSIKEILRLPITEWKNFLKNDFEETVFRKFPLINEIKNKMYEQGALYVSMSGSGSAVYGIFKEVSFGEKEFSNCTTWSGKL
ncbi:MAG: 4-(cytidine 5'-diphospho)-2-C-methyl-D-erythritol kinase [Bacteroidia bacterium]